MQLKSIVALVAVALPVSAWAQSGGNDAPSAPTEPSVPNIPLTPQSPIELPVPIIVNPQAAPAAKGAAGGEKAAPTGYSGGDLIIGDTRSELLGEGAQPKHIPLYHVVKEGETMWTLCSYYYNDPWAWPQLWAYNKSITNPHWIYPGDRIRLLGGSAEAPRPPGGEDLIPPPKRKLRTVRLRQQALVEDKDLSKAGRIIGSQQPKCMLTRFDEFYVAKNKEFKPELGRLYSIYRVREELRNSDGKRVGYLVMILGTARVKRMSKGQAATAVIVEAFRPIHRNDRVGPLRRNFRTMPMRIAKKDLEGRVVANLDGTETVGTDRILFVDRGRSQGVKVGNRMLVVRRGDGIHSEDPTEQMDEDESQFPDETVAEISILDVKDNASMGIVTRALVEVRDNDIVQMKKGY